MWDWYDPTTVHPGGPVAGKMCSSLEPGPQVVVLAPATLQ